MIIKRNMIADVYYEMKDEYGNIADSNKEYSPLQYLHGHNNILPALEVVLEGLSANEEKYITLSPQQAYGKYNSALVFEVDKNQLGQDVELQEGMVIEAADGREFTVISLTNDIVTLDGNHPLAGKALNLFVKVVAVREATLEEIGQGQPMILKSSCCGPKGCC